METSLRQLLLVLSYVVRVSERPKVQPTTKGTTK